MFGAGNIPLEKQEARPEIGAAATNAKHARAFALMASK
jgi:hypothetical protein